MHSSMTEKERLLISSWIEQELGIRMPPAKKVLLESRLSRRLRALGIRSYGEYFSYVRSASGRKDELPVFVDLVSTHETSFFREPSHFSHLQHAALPDLLFRRNAGANLPLRILCAGCSTGEEAYSISMAIEDFRRMNRLDGLRYEVVGFDISQRAVEVARRGVYPEPRLNTVPLQYRSSYFRRSRERAKALVRVVPEIRMRTGFLTFNLMSEFYPFGSFDIVFFRNTLIYFERPVQELTCSRLVPLLREGGYFYISHSETVSGFLLPLTGVAPSVFRRW